MRSLCVSLLGSHGLVRVDVCMYEVCVYICRSLQGSSDIDRSPLECKALSHDGAALV